MKDLENKIKLNEKQIKEEFEKNNKLLKEQLNEKNNKLIDLENKINLNEEVIYNQTKEINELKILLKKNEINNNIINENENYFKNFKIENMQNIKTLNNNQGTIWCLKTLDDWKISCWR